MMITPTISTTLHKQPRESRKQPLKWSLRGWGGRKKLKKGSCEQTKPKGWLWLRMGIEKTLTVGREYRTLAYSSWETSGEKARTSWITLRKNCSIAFRVPLQDLQLLQRAESGEPARGPDIKQVLNDLLWKEKEGGRIGRTVGNR